MPILDKGIRLLFNTPSNTLSVFGITSVRNYAARKGTRARRAKAKVKVEVQKVGFIPHNQRNLEKFLATRPKLKFDDSWKQLPTDNVYPHRYYQWRVYPFQEAIQCLREINHPEMYNLPDANVQVRIELNMEGEKKNKFVDNFQRIAAIPHAFEHGEERSVIAFSKSEKMQAEAREAGASMAGGVELIKDIQNGQISLSDFQFIVAEPAILPELVILRGVMKRRFPNQKANTLDDDVVQMVKRLTDGLNYSAAKDEFEKDFGLIQTVIGNLKMDPKQLEENFAALVQDIYLAKPKREGSFISRCLLWCPPTHEKLKVDHNLYIKDKQSGIKKEQQKDDEAEKQSLIQ